MTEIRGKKTILRVGGFGFLNPLPSITPLVLLTADRVDDDRPATPPHQSQAVTGHPATIARSRGVHTMPPLPSPPCRGAPRSNRARRVSRSAGSAQPDVSPYNRRRRLSDRRASVSAELTVSRRAEPVQRPCETSETVSVRQFECSTSCSVSTRLMSSPADGAGTGRS